MRKGILKCILLMIFSVILSGCAKEPAKSKLPLKEHAGGYSTTANITYKELRAVAAISQETPSSCSVTFESPPSLESMGFIFRQDGVDMSYKGLSFSFEPDSLPGGAVARLAVSAINKAMNDDGLSVGIDGSALEVRGIMESGDFILRMDKETGNLIKLSVPGEELEIEFVNFRFLD